MFADNPSYDASQRRDYELEILDNVMHSSLSLSLPPQQNQNQTTQQPNQTAPAPQVATTPTPAPPQQNQQASSAQAIQPAPLFASKKETPICKYFLKGSCLIRNCPYRHTTQVACKFFLQGFCMRGKECDFIHTYDFSAMNEVFQNISMEMNSESNDPSKRRPENQPSFSLNEFPSLAPAPKAQPESKSSKKKKKGKGPQNNQAMTNNNNLRASQEAQQKQQVQMISPSNTQQSELNLASRLKLHQMQEKFNHVPKEIVAQTFVSTNYNAEQTIQTLVEFYGAPEDVSGSEPELKDNELSSESNSSDNTAKKTVFTSVPKLWVETGESVAQVYEQYRTEAIEHALLRNKYFSVATASYLSGDGLTAREFSRKGRYHQEKMKELHAKASEQIFLQRNQRPVGEHLQNGETIDLHGLHVSEALQLLERYMSSLTAGLKYFYILTGTGHHSLDSRSRLLPAIRDFLDEYGCSWVDCSDDQRGGLLRVSLPQ